jgi:hypothetical protein
MAHTNGVLVMEKKRPYHRIGYGRYYFLLFNVYFLVNGNWTVRF